MGGVGASRQIRGVWNRLLKSRAEPSRAQQRVALRFRGSATFLRPQKRFYSTRLLITFSRIHRPPPTHPPGPIVSCPRMTGCRDTLMLSVNTAFDGEQGPKLFPHPFSADTHRLKTTAEHQHGAHCCSFIPFLWDSLSKTTQISKAQCGSLRGIFFFFCIGWLHMCVLGYKKPEGSVKHVAAVLPLTNAKLLYRHCQSISF